MSFSDYNQDLLISFRAIDTIFRDLPAGEIAQLRAQISAYVDFRQALERFHFQYFESTCQKSCFETGLSACCSFESIIVFFADQVINYLNSEPEEIAVIFRVLERPNTSGKCVFLGNEGCIWRVRPVSCATFFCDQAKKKVFAEHPETESSLKDFQKQEEEFTWPVKPVLFDEIEKYFINLGVESPHLYFHKSPGLLQLKARAKAKPELINR